MVSSYISPPVFCPKRALCVRVNVGILIPLLSPPFMISQCEIPLACPKITGSFSANPLLGAYGAQPSHITPSAIMWYSISPIEAKRKDTFAKVSLESEKKLNNLYFFIYSKILKWLQSFISQVWSNYPLTISAVTAIFLTIWVICCSCSLFTSVVLLQLFCCKDS